MLTHNPNSAQYPVYVDPSSPEVVAAARQEAFEVLKDLGGESIAGAFGPNPEIPTEPLLADVEAANLLTSEPLIPDLTDEEKAQALSEAKQELLLDSLDTEPKLYLHLAERLLPRPDDDPNGNPLDPISSYFEGAPATHMIFELVRAYAAIGEIDKADEIIDYFPASKMYDAANGLKRLEEIAAAQIASGAGGFEPQAQKVQDLRQQLVTDVKSGKITLGMPTPSRQSDVKVHQALEEGVASVLGEWDQAREIALKPEREHENEQQAADLEKLRRELMEEAKRTGADLWVQKPSTKGPRLIDSGKLEQIKYMAARREESKRLTLGAEPQRGYHHWTSLLRYALLPDAQLPPNTAPSRLINLFVQNGPKEVATAVATATKVDQQSSTKKNSVDTMIAVCEFAVGRQRQLWREMA